MGEKYHLVTKARGTKCPNVLENPVKLRKWGKTELSPQVVIDFKVTGGSSHFVLVLLCLGLFPLYPEQSGRQNPISSIYHPVPQQTFQLMSLYHFS